MLGPQQCHALLSMEMLRAGHIYSGSSSVHNVGFVCSQLQLHPLPLERIIFDNAI